MFTNTERSNIIEKYKQQCSELAELKKKITEIETLITNKSLSHYPPEIVELALAGKYIYLQNEIDMYYFKGALEETLTSEAKKWLHHYMFIKFNTNIPFVLQGYYTTDDINRIRTEFGEEFYKELTKKFEEMIHLANSVGNKLSSLYSVLESSTINLRHIKKYYPSLYKLIKDALA